MPRPGHLAILAGALLILTVVGCASAGSTAPVIAPAPATTVADAKPDQQQILYNSAALLDDLLSDEKNLSKVLMIKGHSGGDFGTLVKAISHAAEVGDSQLQGLAQSQPGLDLKALGLPPGEVAARKAIAKTKEHDLLLSAGSNFEFNLLLTQSQALAYGSHLAGVVADNTPNKETAKTFKELSAVLDRLLRQVTVMMRQEPPS